MRADDSIENERGLPVPFKMCSWNDGFVVSRPMPAFLVFLCATSLMNVPYAFSCWFIEQMVQSFLILFCKPKKKSWNSKNRTLKTRTAGIGSSSKPSSSSDDDVDDVFKWHFLASLRRNEKCSEGPLCLPHFSCWNDRRNIFRCWSKLEHHFSIVFEMLDFVAIAVLQFEKGKRTFNGQSCKKKNCVLYSTFSYATFVLRFIW